MIPYGRPCVDEEDIEAVSQVLRSPWLTTGPRVPEFEAAVAARVGTAHAVAMSSGTAALHAAMHVAQVGPADEVIVPPMTFVATANAVLFQGGTPVFADVEPETLLLDPVKVEDKITPKTKAIVAVDYAGHPADYDALRSLADQHGLLLIADACHSLGAEYKGRKVGALADLTVFSFHPVKHITTGEGGMVMTNNGERAHKMRRFRNHGIDLDHHQREIQGTWFYEMTDLGFNYRISDFQCALGISQLPKLEGWLARRREIADRYAHAFAELPQASPLLVRPFVSCAYHLYIVRLNLRRLRANRADLFVSLRRAGIGVNVHYIPVHLQPFYRSRFGTGPGDCPVAEAAYEEILTLPIFPSMSDEDVQTVIDGFSTALREYAA